MRPTNVPGYVTGIGLKNIRAFTDLHLNISDANSPHMLSVIIGRNGTCKSTLLRCIALALCHEQDAGALLATPNVQLISEGAGEGSIQLEMATAVRGRRGKIELRLGRSGDRDVILERRVSTQRPTGFVCGYGAARGNVGTTQVRGYRAMDSVASLFDYERRLVDPELMLRRLEDHLGTSRYERAMLGIRRVLGLRREHRLQYAKGGGVRVSGPGIGENIPLDGWADGYRLTFNWLIDLYGWAMQADAVTKTGGIRGILLIDEIEQHLHPAMQSGLLAELQEALPEIQMFATTHSPLVALGTQSHNVIALHRKEHEIYVASVPSLEGYSAEDALVEEALFGTDPYPPETRAKLERHRELAAMPRPKRTRRQATEMKKLAAELDPAKLPRLRDDPVAKKLEELLELLSQESRT